MNHYNLLWKYGLNMCELFGISGKKEVKIERDLREFFSHAPDNPNGWGLFLSRENNPLFMKENQRADRSDALNRFLAQEIKARNAIAHIRYATIGYDLMENTHPFIGKDASGRKWIFAHNGTIFEDNTLTEYFHMQTGETDSERILLYILDCMNDSIRQSQCAPDEDERFEILQKVVFKLSPRNKLNLLIYDGEIMYVHTNCKDSLFERNRDGDTSFSTKPLSDGVWTNVPFAKLVSYKDGVRRHVGRCHGNEYIPDPDSIEKLFLAYSGL